MTVYSLNLLPRCLMKAGKSTEFNLKLEVPIWSNFLLAMSGAGQEEEEEEGRQAAWLALAGWPV